MVKSVYHFVELSRNQLRSLPSVGNVVKQRTLEAWVNVPRTRSPRALSPAGQGSSSCQPMVLSNSRIARDVGVGRRTLVASGGNASRQGGRRRRLPRSGVGRGRPVTYNADRVKQESSSRRRQSMLPEATAVGSTRTMPEGPGCDQGDRPTHMLTPMALQDSAGAGRFKLSKDILTLPRS